MRRTDGLFTRRERRIAILAAVLVIVITALALIYRTLYQSEDIREADARTFRLNRQRAIRREDRRSLPRHLRRPSADRHG